jgi:integrase
MRFLTPDDVDLLAETIDPRFGVLVLTAAYTRMRFEELAGLRMPRLNLFARTLTVAETCVEVGGRVIFGPPKTAASRRTVNLPELLVDQIAAHLTAYPLGNKDLVFRGPMGGLLRRTSFRNRFWKRAVAASVGEPCRFHDLRHTHVALLIAAGENPKVIQQRLGHGLIRTTLDTYGHLFKGLDEAAAGHLDTLYNQLRQGRDGGGATPGGLETVVDFPTQRGDAGEDSHRPPD